MRLVPGTDTVPNAVNKYLLPHEHQVITVRKHPAVLLKPILIVLAGLVVAAVISTTVGRHQSGVIGGVWIAWAILLLYLVEKVWEWSQDYFIVTSRRMLLATGVVTRKVAMMPLVKVTDMSFQRSTLGRLLGYGEFILESAGQEQALRVVDHLPYPEQLYLEVCGLIFPGKAEGDDDDL
jgi:membrane protein YdbS with pleckstrin-like domain